MLLNNQIRLALYLDLCITGVPDLHKPAYKWSLPPHPSHHHQHQNMFKVGNEVLITGAIDIIVN
jgi:hypothetical protein